MAFGRDAAQTQFDALLDDQSSGDYPLAEALVKMQRNETPHLDLTKVLYALHSVPPDADWGEATKGFVITTSSRWELVLSRFMAEGSIEGTASYEEASRAIIAVAERLRHRFSEPSNWNPGTTGIVLLRDFRMTSRGVKREPWRLEFRYQFEVVIDEEPT